MHLTYTISHNQSKDLSTVIDLEELSKALMYAPPITKCKPGLVTLPSDLSNSSTAEVYIGSDSSLALSFVDPAKILPVPETKLHIIWNICMLPSCCNLKHIVDILTTDKDNILIVEAGKG
ncbi:hypothetical protein E5288_WYG007356 [Bos mutus]|uniref:Uncharacterized protein n=1 Tax=Bos mutus TaxID=72004 RepID=A0A6B0RVV4_9CETA|nr:hypothetical protein [Bos mutus]